MENSKLLHGNTVIIRYFPSVRTDGATLLLKVVAQTK